jgi:hypothetical protein
MLSDVMRIPASQLTWWRIVVWGLSNGLVTLDDTVEDVVAEAHVHRSQRHVGLEDEGLALELELQGSSSSSLSSSAAAATAGTSAADEPSLGLELHNSLQHEVGECWQVMQAVHQRLRAAEASLVALLPEEQAVAALVPSLPSGGGGGGAGGGGGGGDGDGSETESDGGTSVGGFEGSDEDVGDAGYTRTGGAGNSQVTPSSRSTTRRHRHKVRCCTLLFAVRGAFLCLPFAWPQQQ